MSKRYIVIFKDKDKTYAGAYSSFKAIRIGQRRFEIMAQERLKIDKIWDTKELKIISIKDISY